MQRLQVGSVEHDSTIFSLALSPDERFLACGGAYTPVSVWDLAEGTAWRRLSGLNHQAQSVAFSPDGNRLAAVNLWGGLCVWDLPSGKLLESRPESDARRIRSVAFSPSTRGSTSPSLLSDSIHSQSRRLLAPDGRYLAVKAGGFDLRLVRTKGKAEIAALRLDQYDDSAVGARTFAWSPDARTIALSGAGWIGAWKPLETSTWFRCCRLPSLGGDEPLVLSNDASVALAATGGKVKLVELPAAQSLTRWQQVLMRTPDPAAEEKLQREWRWAETSWGYEGVHTYEGKLLWFSHSHNPHAGGGALEQSFESFLASGPTVQGEARPPDEILIKICQAVRRLTAQGQQPSAGVTE